MHVEHTTNHEKVGIFQKSRSCMEYTTQNENNIFRGVPHELAFTTSHEKVWIFQGRGK
jgi:hypothetical protein